MTKKERILRLSSSRMHLGWLMDFFERYEKWESYFKCCCLFRAYDDLLKAELRSKKR